MASDVELLAAVFVGLAAKESLIPEDVLAAAERFGDEAMALEEEDIDALLRRALGLPMQ